MLILTLKFVLASSQTEEMRLIRRLKDAIDAQKVELRTQRRILTQRTIDLDAVSQKTPLYIISTEII